MAPIRQLDLPFGLCLRNPFGGDDDNEGCHTELSTSQGEKYAGVALGAAAAITGVGAFADASAFGLNLGVAGTGVDIISMLLGGCGGG